MTLATLRVSCWGGARRSIRARTTCTVSGTDSSQVGAWCEPAAPVGDGDDTGVTEGVGELLAEERVTASVLADELGHRPGYQGDPELLPDERGEVISRQGIEAKLLGIGRLAEPLVVLRDGFSSGRRASTNSAVGIRWATSLARAQEAESHQ